MTAYRFSIDDPANPWATAIEVDADNEYQAVIRAESYLFARRDAGTHAGAVRLTLEER